MLGGNIAVLQAPMFDGLSFDPFALCDDGFSPAELSIGGCYVAQAVVLAPVIAMLYESLEPTFEIAGQEVVFQLDAVLQ